MTEPRITISKSELIDWLDLVFEHGGNAEGRIMELVDKLFENTDINDPKQCPNCGCNPELGTVCPGCGYAESYK